MIPGYYFFESTRKPFKPHDHPEYRQSRGCEEWYSKVDISPYFSAFIRVSFGRGWRGFEGCSGNVGTCLHHNHRNLHPFGSPAVEGGDRIVSSKVSTKKGALSPLKLCSTQIYFLNLAKRLLYLSIRPAVSTKVTFPVKKGCEV